MAVVQRQDSLTDQLRSLVSVATFHGMYDAADFLTTIVTKTDEAVASIRAVINTPEEPCP